MLSRVRKRTIIFIVGSFLLGPLVFLSFLYYKAGDLSLASDNIPSWGSSIVASPLDDFIWVVNPDNGSITAIDVGTLEKIAELPVGQTPWSLSISPDSRYVYVADRAAGTLVVVAAQDYTVQTTIPVGAEPGAVALSPTGAKAYVTLVAEAKVAVVDTGSKEVSARIPVEPNPYGIAITNDGDEKDDDEKIYVTHFLAIQRTDNMEIRDDSKEGRVTVIDARTNTVTDEIALLPDEHGFPNLLAGITISGSRAWIPQIRAAPDLPRDLTTTIFAAVSNLDLRTGMEDSAAHLPLNDPSIFGSPVNNPVAAIPSPDGQRLYVVLAGSDLVEVIDIANPNQPRLIKLLPTGRNPRGMALSSNGRHGYVMNYLSRSVTIFDLEQLEKQEDVIVTNETLDPNVLRGKIFFNNASDPRLSSNSWLSCASCHPDGNPDGVTWMFPDGPRQTPPLWNATQTLPWHWSAAMDEAQDVEETIEVIQNGVGLASGSDPALLGMPNSGRSFALDSLAAFLARGIRVPSPALPQSDIIKQGRHLFQSAGCVDCHSGPTWTVSHLPGPPNTLDPDGNGMIDDNLYDVGTLNSRDIRGKLGFDPPSLLNVSLTAPYLHDGSMPTLEALIITGHPTHKETSLTREEITTLVAFLRSIGPNTIPLTNK